MLGNYFLQNKQKEEFYHKTGRLYDFAPTNIEISQDQYQKIVKGTEQRARVLRAFMEDIFSEDPQVFRQKLFPEKLVKNVCHRWDIRKKYINNEDFNFIYGPDLLISEDERYFVLEDNLTVVCGLACGLFNYNYMSKIDGQYQDSAGLVENYLLEIIKNMKERALDHHGEVAYLQYAIPDMLAGFLPKARLYQFEKNVLVPFLKQQGVHIVSCSPLTPQGLAAGKSGYQWVEVKKDGTIVLNKRSWIGARKTIPIGFFWMNICTDHIFKWSLPGLAQSYKDGKTGLSHSPGVDLCNDKIWYPYMEELTRFYLGEEPLLDCVEALVFGEKHSLKGLNHSNFNKVFDRLENWVIKHGNGAGGQKVWIGKDLVKEAKEKAMLEGLIKKEPWSYMAQKYIVPKTFSDQYIADLRPITYVAPDRINVQPIPWSRGVSPKRSKLNVGANTGESLQPIINVTPS